MTRPDYKNFRWSEKMDRAGEHRKGIPLGYRSEPLSKALKRRITLPKALHTGDVNFKERVKWTD